MKFFPSLVYGIPLSMRYLFYIFGHLSHLIFSSILIFYSLQFFPCFSSLDYPHSFPFKQNLFSNDPQICAFSSCGSLKSQDNISNCLIDTFNSMFAWKLKLHYLPQPSFNLSLSFPSSNSLIQKPKSYLGHLDFLLSFISPTFNEFN